MLDNGWNCQLPLKFKLKNPSKMAGGSLVLFIEVNVKVSESPFVQDFTSKLVS